MNDRRRNVSKMERNGKTERVVDKLMTKKKDDRIEENKKILKNHYNREICHHGIEKNDEGMTTE